MCGPSTGPTLESHPDCPPGDQQGPLGILMQGPLALNGEAGDCSWALRDWRFSAGFGSRFRFLPRPSKDWRDGAGQTPGLATTRHGLTSQHGRLLGRGHPQAFWWPSLAPWGQLLLLHSEGRWGQVRTVSHVSPGQGLTGMAPPCPTQAWVPRLEATPQIQARVPQAKLSSLNPPTCWNQA